MHRVSCAAVAPGLPVKQGGMAGASLFRPPVSVGGNISVRAPLLAPGARASGECCNIGDVVHAMSPMF